MINVRDYAVTINGETIVPIKRRTFMGLVLEYNDKYDKHVGIVYPMSKYEEDHADDTNIISTIKSYVQYEFMQ